MTMVHKIGIVGLSEIGATMMFWPLLWNIDNIIRMNGLSDSVKVDFILRENRGQDKMFKSLRHIHVKKFESKDLLRPWEYDLFINPFPFQTHLVRVFNRIKGKRCLTPFTKKSLRFNKSDASLKAHNYYMSYLDEIVTFLGMNKQQINKYPPYKVTSRKVLSKLKLSEKKYVVFSPASDASLTSWSEEIFKYFYNLSKKADKLPIFIVGTKSFMDYAKYDVIDLTKKTSLSEVFELLQFSKKNYVTETGTMHISSHMGVDTVSAMSAITPWFLTEDLPNVKGYLNEKICPHFPCHMKFPVSLCPFEKRYCLTNAIPTLSEAKRLKKKLWQK